MYVIGSFKKRANTALREVLDWLANQGVPLAYTPDLHFSKQDKAIASVPGEALYISRGVLFENEMLHTLFSNADKDEASFSGKLDLSKVEALTRKIELEQAIIRSLKRESPGAIATIEKVIGYEFPSEGITLYSGAKKADNLGSILVHEATHLLDIQHSIDDFWAFEGIATYVMNRFAGVPSRGPGLADSHEDLTTLLYDGVARFVAEQYGEDLPISRLFDPTFRAELGERVRPFMINAKESELHRRCSFLEEELHSQHGLVPIVLGYFTLNLGGITTSTLFAIGAMSIRGKFDGMIVEECNEKTKTAHANGSIALGSIQFIKTYAGPLSIPVEYSGQGNGYHLQGGWKIDTSPLTGLKKVIADAIPEGSRFGSFAAINYGELEVHNL